MLKVARSDEPLGELTTKVYKALSTQIWSPHYKYLIDKIESVQRYFTKRLSGLRQLSYLDRLAHLNLETLERRRLVYDLVFCYKILHLSLIHI